jgi:hypothetical protein
MGKREKLYGGVKARKLYKKKRGEIRRDRTEVRRDLVSNQGLFDRMEDERWNGWNCVRSPVLIRA